jgi:hypothetical protein
MNGIVTTTFRATADPFEIYRGQLAIAVRDLRVRLQAVYERRFPGEGERIREAIAEAEVAAWHTEFPHLFLPDLAEEAVGRLSISSNPEQRDGITSLTNVA